EHVELDDRLVGQVDQGGGLVADHVAEGPALLLDLDAGDPVREVLARVLLEDPLLGDAVRVPGHGDRPVLQVRQHGVGDLGVELDQLALGDAVVGKHHLAGVAELEALPRGLDVLAVDGDARAHWGTTRTASEAALPRLRAGNRRWRSCRSRVYTEKTMWANSSNRTQCAWRSG